MGEMYTKRLGFKFVSIVLLLVMLFLVSGDEFSFAQEPVPGSAPLVFVAGDGFIRSVLGVRFVYNSITSQTFLRSDGSAVRFKNITVQNDSSTPLERLNWCYYWGEYNEYTNIFSEDSEGFLETEYYMYQHSTYGWGLCVDTIFRNPVQYGESYSYSDSITIGQHNSVNGDVIYATWWTDPIFAQTYTEDVRWPFNHEGVIADPSPDVLNPAQALWYRTNQDGKFYINLQITLGDTMAVLPLSQGTFPFDGQDIPWEDDAYGVGTGDTIGDLGCHLVDSTMMINYYADVLGVAGDIDPGDLNAWLVQPLNSVPTNPPRGYAYCGQFDSYCAVSNVALPAASGDLFNTGGPIVEYLGMEGVQTINDFRDNLQNGELGILNVDNDGYNHFVLVTGITQVNNIETLSINDSYESRGSTTLYDQYNNNHLKNVRWFGIGDESVRSNYVIVQANSPLHLIITDRYGRRTGFDPETGTYYGEIPESSYYIEYPPDVLLSEAEEFKVFEARVLESSTYRIQAIGIGSGSFTLNFSGVTDGGAIDINTIAGYIEEGEVQTFTIEYDPDEGLVYKVYLPLIMK